MVVASAAFFEIQSTRIPASVSLLSTLLSKAQATLGQLGTRDIGSARYHYGIW